MIRSRWMTAPALCAAALLWLSMAAAEARAGGSWQVRGWVTGLRPGSTAQIVLSGPRTYQTTTRPGGAWQIDQVASGTYQVAPSSPGYSFSPPGRRVKVGVSDVNAINFRALGGPQPASPALSPGQEQRRLGGRIVGLKAGDAVTVAVSGPDQREIMTRPGGKFTFDDLSPGTYRLSLSDARYRFRPAALNVNLTRADRRNVKIRARRKPGARPQVAKVQPKRPETFRLTGKVTGLKAVLSGCTGARVVARGPKTYSVKTRTIDSEAACGTYTFPALEAGEYEIVVHPPTLTMFRWSFNPSRRRVKVHGDVSGVDFDATSRERRRRRRRY